MNSILRSRTLRQRFAALPALAPGLALCAVVTAAASALESIESLLFGRAWLESLVLAILLGVGVRTWRRPHRRYQAGVDFSAKIMLEIAIVLLGASVSAGSLLDAGPALIGGIALVVVVAIAASYAIGRAAGLSTKMALLIACGNSICGNSAIAAVAPVIDADGGDMAASIAFTAVLGVAVVLGLPLLVGLLAFSQVEYGIFAGLTVYAVPQVLAATGPVGAASLQIGTVVKLVRVLMLGPVVLMLSLFGRAHTQARPSLARLVPWFILGFLLMLGLRSLGAIPAIVLAPAREAASFLTVMSMAALGLGVDARAVLRAGARVATVVVLSLLALAGFSLALIKILAI